MHGSVTFKKADVERALKAVRKAGCEVAGLEITKDGTIRVIFKSEEKTNSLLEEWLSRREKK